MKVAKKPVKKEESVEKKEKRPKVDKEKPDKANNDKTPHTSGVKRKLEEGECDPEPSENKRHER